MNTPSSSEPAAQGSWLAVVALALAAFIFNTTEFAPVGLLSMIGQSFGMRTEDVGLMLTIYAWVVALGSLPLMLATGKMDRRRLLIGVFLVFIVSHGVSAVASQYWVLMASRLGIAASHAIFWSITPSLAVRMAPQGRASQGLGLLSTGSSLAMVLGIPLGRAVRLLPALPSQNSGSLSSLPVLLRRPALVSIYVLIVVGVTAHFTTYSYLEPFLQHVAGLQGQAITLVLLVFGGSGLIGSVLFGWRGSRNPAIFLLGSLLFMGLSLLTLEPLAHHAGWLLGMLVTWGTMMMCFSLSMQARVLALASDATDVAMALFSGLFNLGIGGGALLGNQVAIYWGLDHLGLVGGALALVTMLGLVLAIGRFGQTLLRAPVGGQVAGH